MEYCKEWQRTLGEGWGDDRKKTDVQKKQKKKSKQTEDGMTHTFQKGEVCTLGWAVTYLNLEPQEDTYIENVNPESQ